MGSDNDTRGERERAYDEHFSPLMVQIIALAKKHGIPMVASFELDATEDDGPMLCTTCIVPKGSDRRLVNASRALYPPAPQAFAITVFTPNEKAVPHAGE